MREGVVEEFCFKMSNTKACLSIDRGDLPQKQNLMMRRDDEKKG